MSASRTDIDVEGYVDIGGDLYPADRVGSDGKPLPISDEQARRIADILEEEYESNPAFREAVNARAKMLAEERGAA